MSAYSKFFLVSFVTSAALFTEEIRYLYIGYCLIIHFFNIHETKTFLFTVMTECGALYNDFVPCSTINVCARILIEVVGNSITLLVLAFN